MIEIKFEVDGEMNEDLKALAKIAGLPLDEFIKELLKEIIDFRRNVLKVTGDDDAFNQFLEDI